jgi:RNA polymerase sigma-70 factor (ECF subfamily)
LPLTSPHDEKELLVLLKNGQESAFEKIYNLYSARIFGNVFKMVKSKSIAQEILQDVFLKVWDSRANIDQEKSFRSYLFRIAENKVYDFFRKASRDKRIRTLLLTAATEQYDHIEEYLLRKENSLLLQNAISSLSPQRQQVFRLCKLEGKTYEEVSRDLGISQSTISDHIVKGTKAVKEYIFNNAELGIVVYMLTCYQYL